MFRFIQSLFFSLFFVILSSKSNAAESTPKKEKTSSDLILSEASNKQGEPMAEQPINGGYYRDFIQNATYNKRSMSILGY